MTEPSDSAIQSDAELRESLRKLYRVLFAREPDPDGFESNLRVMRSGASFEDMFDAFVSSEEYAERQALMWQHFRCSGDVVPYALNRVEGADHLLVTFPGATIGGRPLRRHLDDWGMDDVPIHHLDIGSDTEVLELPRGLAGPVGVAAELIRDMAQELSIPLENVISVGCSFAGACALFVGFSASVGRIIVGGPPVRLGWLMDKMQAAMAEHDQSFVARMQKVANLTGDWEADRDFLDHQIIDAAWRIEEQCSVEVFTSPRDMLFGDGEWLVEKISDAPGIDVRLERASYLGHNSVEPAFYEYLRRRLTDILALGNDK